MRIVAFRLQRDKNAVLPHYPRAIALGFALPTP